MDILVTNKRDKKAAIRFFKKLFKGQVQQPRLIVTDKLRSYQAALRELNCDTEHVTEQYANNVAELSHQKTRQQQRQMRQFKSVGQAQHFLTCHDQINNHFRQQRRLLKAGHYRTLRDRAFESWSQVSSVQLLEMAS